MDLNVGDFFTIRCWIDSRDNSYKGNCFEAKIIDYPFVRATQHSQSYNTGELITLNLDRIEIMPLTKEFVDSVLKEKPNDSQ